MADAGEPDDGLTPYERLRAARIAANAEMMRRLGLPELGSALRSPSTPSGSGDAGGAGQGVPAKRRSPKGKPGPNADSESRKREFRMVLRVRKEVNYAEVVDEPKPRPAKFPRIDDPAGAHGRAAATVDPDTKLENLDSKYDNDEKARNRAIRFVALWHNDQPTWIEENKVQWGTLREKRNARRAAKAAAEAAASERRALADHESVGVGATRAAPGSASDDVADPEPAAAPPTPVVSPAGGGGRRGKRFTGAKKDPTSVRGAARFIALGVPLICSECDAEEASRWTGSKADPNKPVCDSCYKRQLAATRGNCVCCEIAGADAGEMRKSRSTDGAWLCKKCWGKEAPADRVCASCDAGVDAVKAWRKSKRIEGTPWLCKPCYNRERTEILTAAGTTCSKCGSCKASSWNNSPDVPGVKVCMACLLRESRQKNPTSKKKKK